MSTSFSPVLDFISDKCGETNWAQHTCIHYPLLLTADVSFSLPFSAYLYFTFLKWSLVISVFWGYCSFTFTITIAKFSYYLSWWFPFVLAVLGLFSCSLKDINIVCFVFKTDYHCDVNLQEEIYIFAHSFRRLGLLWLGQYGVAAEFITWSARKQRTRQEAPMENMPWRTHP